ncbi:MAG: hypothetical protein K6E18_00905 [Lachnospiraceae bacterium]|nr:hypothetical protein [Lachnospiraceae bacterium]
MKQDTSPGSTAKSKKIRSYAAKTCGYLLLFFMMYFLLLGLFLLSVKTIPRDRVLPNLKRSAEFLKDKDPLAMEIEGILASRRDYTCDPYFLCILYYQDSENAAYTIAKAPYYTEEKEVAPRMFYHAVTNDPPANTEYLRYWHGGTAIVRVLLLFTDLVGIYRLFAIVFALLYLLLTTLLLLHKHLSLWVCLSVCFAAGSLWFAAGAIEFIWSALLMLLFSLIVTLLCRYRKEKLFAPLCLVVGMLTAFLDFLTYETVTLTVPAVLFCGLCLANNKDIKQVAKQSAKGAAAWLFGYVCMWAGKWVYAALILQENVMPYVTGHIEERLVGEMPLPDSYLAGSFVLLHREFAALFPFGYGKAGLVLGLMGLLVLAAFCYVFHKKGADRRVLLLYLLWSLVPILRFLVLRNHTATHIAYTFRALMGTVLAWTLMLVQGLDLSPFQKKHQTSRKR